MTIRAASNREVRLSGAFAGRALRFIPYDSFEYLALVPIDAQAEPGTRPLRVEARDLRGQRASVAADAVIQSAGFATERIRIPESRAGLLEPTIVRREAEQLSAICSRFVATRAWEGLFQLPHGGRVTSYFGSRRSYNGGPTSSYHTGVDIDGEGGEPVGAAADGVVALAEPLQVRGNTVIIDHGWGVFSLYAHLAEVRVEAGQQVARGDAIGLLGETGLATGTHLHWEIRVNDTPTEPLAWTETEIP